MTTIGNSIPLDLLIEIFLKLPAKSVFRFRCVSKSWRSIITSQQFIEAFMSLSLTRSRLLLASRDFDQNSRDGLMFFFSSPHQNSFFLSSSSILSNSLRGLVCYWFRYRFMVCNPTTGQVIPLNKRNYPYSSCRMYLGYDSNNNQYKVLRLMFHPSSGPPAPIEHSVCTLGGQGSSHSWRPIKTSNILYTSCYYECVCIDGVVYYQYQNHRNAVLSGFDVESEQLSLIRTPEDLAGKLTNYIGKLGVHSSIDNEIILWILDDVKNQVWSKRICICQSFVPSKLSFMGITASGEIIYAPSWFYNSCELLCYDLEKKMESRVRLEGLPKNRRFSPSKLCSYAKNLVYL